MTSVTSATKPCIGGNRVLKWPILEHGSDLIDLHCHQQHSSSGGASTLTWSGPQWDLQLPLLLSLHLSIQVPLLNSTSPALLWVTRSPLCAPVCPMSCGCVPRTRRRFCTNLVLAATSPRSPSVSLRASSPSPPWLKASTSASSWTRSCSASKRKTPASPWLVRLHCPCCLSEEKGQLTYFGKITQLRSIKGRSETETLVIARKREAGQDFKIRQEMQDVTISQAKAS